MEALAEQAVYLKRHPRLVYSSEPLLLLKVNGCVCTIPT